MRVQTVVMLPPHRVLWLRAGRLTVHATYILATVLPIQGSFGVLALFQPVNDAQPMHSQDTRGRRFLKPNDTHQHLR